MPDALDTITESDVLEPGWESGLLTPVLSQSGTLYYPGAPDKWGARADGDGTAVACRVVRRQELVRAGDGEQVLCRAIAYLPSTASPEGADRLAQGGTTWQVLAAEELLSPGGTRLGWKVYLV